MLDTLPSEIISMTAFHACTDGGFTGCSLAQVSRHLRDATRVARFYTVALAKDPQQVTDFLACYQSEASGVPNNKPRVRHLFLSLLGQSDAFTSEQLQSEIDAAPSERHRRKALLDALMRFIHDHDDYSEQYSRVVPDLIVEVAPDLYTLALVQSRFGKLPTSIVEFPALKELALVGGDPKFQRFDKLGGGSDSSGSQPPLYPSLRRLHHVLQWQLRAEDDVDFEPWSRHAPNLTHLRVSRLERHPPVTIHTLIRAYSKVPGDEVLFPHLEAVLIQPRAAPNEGEDEPVFDVGDHSSLSHFVMMEELEETMTESRVETTLLDGWVDGAWSDTQSVFGDTPQKLQDEWLERVVGGAGCWSSALPMSDEPQPEAQ